MSLFGRFSPLYHPFFVAVPVKNYSFDQLWESVMRNLNISPRQHLSIIIIIIIFLLSSSRIVVVPRTGKNMLFGAAAFISLR